MKQQISTKRVLLDLLYIKEQVIVFFKDNDRYKQLLKFLSEKDYLDESVPIPTFKEIEILSGIKLNQIRKQLIEMHELIFNSEEDFEFDFKDCEIYFFIKDYKNHASFKCNSLTYLPRIGENFDLPFLRSRVGRDLFYVDDVMHCFQGKKHSIYIYLKGGLFNSYWYNRLHEAEEKRELSFNDFSELNEWQLKERLL